MIITIGHHHQHHLALHVLLLLVCLPVGLFYSVSCPDFLLSTESAWPAWQNVQEHSIKNKRWEIEEGGEEDQQEDNWHEQLCGEMHKQSRKKHIAPQICNRNNTRNQR